MNVKGIFQDFIIMNIRKVYNTSCHDIINCLIHSDNRIKCINSVNFVVTKNLAYFITGFIHSVLNFSLNLTLHS